MERFAGAIWQSQRTTSRFTGAKCRRNLCASFPNPNYLTLQDFGGMGREAIHPVSGACAV